jgi:hypothetical protein
MMMMVVVEPEPAEPFNLHDNHTSKRVSEREKKSPIFVSEHALARLLASPDDGNKSSKYPRTRMKTLIFFSFSLSRRCFAI